VGRFLSGLVRSRGGLAGFVVLLLFLLTAAAAPVIATHDPVRTDLRARFAPPTYGAVAQHEALLGRDQLGRDVYSRLVHGSRVTLQVGAAAVLVGGAIGLLVGLLAGYFGGWTDRLLMRLADIQLSFPLMLLALLVIAALGPSLFNLVLTLALTSWTRYARIVRGEVLSLRERDFVQAAIAAGSRPLRILYLHILPNVAAPAIVVGTLEFARVVILESALSFLGLGVQPPQPSWGRMLAEGRAYIASAWWLATWPGLAIMILVLGINLFGDWLRDHLDPRLSGIR